ncbi:MAG: hypothetical protein Q9215_007659 [Flavoplaca cf. flavocitrina]
MVVATMNLVGQYMMEGAESTTSSVDIYYTNCLLASVTGRPTGTKEPVEYVESTQPPPAASGEPPIDKDTHNLRQYESGTLRMG